MFEVVARETIFYKKFYKENDWVCNQNLDINVTGKLLDGKNRAATEKHCITEVWRLSRTDSMWIEGLI